MDNLTKKTIETARGFTYTYWVSPARADKPTLLLLHGFPDEAAEWEGLIRDYLLPSGYGVIAPDLLGYGETSKPTDPAEYKFNAMMADLVEIVDAEKLTKVIPTGHDWGSKTAQMFYNLHPDRSEGLIVVNVAYQPVSNEPFNLDAVLEKTEQIFGYGLFWYWKLFTAPDGAELMNKDPELMFRLAHSNGVKVWPGTLCTKDGVRNTLVEGKKFDLEPYATDAMKKRFVDRMTRDGFDGPVCWYKSTVFGHQDDQGNPANNVVNVPTLFIGYDGDVVCRKELIGPAIQEGLLPHLTNVSLEGYHWGLLGQPKVFGETVLNWLQTNYQVSKL